MSILFMSLMTAIIQTAPGAVISTDSQLLYWSGRMQSLRFEQILDDVGAGPREPWPVIVSTGYASPLGPGEATRQRAFRNVALGMAKKIEAYRNSLRSMDDKKFLRHASKLLALRDYLADRPSYINWVLVDAINQVFIVEVAKRLVKKKPDGGIVRLVPGLGRFHPSMLDFARIATTELGKTVLTPAQVKAGGEVALFNGLWKRLADGDPFPFPHSAGAIGTYDLLSSQHLELLLFRYVGGPEFYFQGAFPRTVEYYKHVGHVLPVHNAMDVISAMKGYATTTTIGEKISRHPMRFHAVYFLIGDVQANWIETRYAVFWSRQLQKDGSDLPKDGK